MFEEFELTCPAEQKNELPSLIRIGSYISDAAKIPVMLPFDVMNGLSIETNEQTRTDALRQMQYIALSLLKQTSPELLNLTFVDIGLNTNFPMLHSLNEEYKLKFITDKDSLKQEIEALFEKARYISTKCLGGFYADLKEYNAEADYKEPYNVLFIANFPNDFHEEEINAVSTLINDGAKCGIYMMMNLDKAFFPENDAYNQKRFAKLYDIPKKMPYLDCTEHQATFNNFNHQTIQDFFAKYAFEFEAYPPKEVKALIDTLNEASRKKDNMPENFLSILIGRSGREEVYFEMGEKADVYHGLIAGASRSGKSTLMNNIITSIADRYSPDEMRLYLLDYKEGVEFQIYENHPNVELLLLDNSNFAVGVDTLKQFRNEISKRSKLFKDLSPTISNINEYNRKATDKLPRMLMIIDEVQQLFTNWQSSREVNPLVKDIARLGGAFGIHLLFCSQSYVDSNIAPDALSQMKLRISYMLANGSECRAILGSDNDAPLRLERFQLVYNTHFGRKEGNIIVKADNFEREKVIALLLEAAVKHKDSKPFAKKVIKRQGETAEIEPIKQNDNPSVTAIKTVERNEYKNNNYADEFGF